MLQLEARAKINWTLNITGRREDGYHLMDMLLQSVTLADIITLEESDQLSLCSAKGAFTSSVTDSDAAASPVPYDERNLAYKAALLLQQHTGCQRGASITLQKNIPSGAGMGGGSADAAAVLYGLNKLWRLKLPMKELLMLGLKLGADVPFMLTGGLAYVAGIGEKITSLSPAPHIWLALVQPCDGLSTKEIFTAYDAPNDDTVISRPDNAAAQRALLSGDLALLGPAMNNVLEGISIAKRPAIRQAARMLEEAGAIRAMMTGSGSVVYGVYESETAALAAQRQLLGQNIRCLVTQTAEAGIVELG